MDVAVGARIDVVASAEVSRETAFGAGAVVVFGEVDGAVGVDAFDPHDVAIDAGSAISDGVGRRGVVDDVAEASGGVAPVFGVAPGGDIDTVIFLSFPSSVASTLANVTANDDITDIISRTPISVRIRIITFTDDAVAIITGDFGGDFLLHSLAGGDGVAGVGFGVVLIALNEDGLLITFVLDLGAASFGGSDEGVYADFLGSEIFFELADSFGGSGDLGFGVGLAGLFFGVISDRAAAGEK